MAESQANELDFLWISKSIFHTVTIGAAVMKNVSGIDPLPAMGLTTEGIGLVRFCMCVSISQ